MKLLFYDGVYVCTLQFIAKNLFLLLCLEAFARDSTHADILERRK